jgi:hypothetical protein
MRGERGRVRVAFVVFVAAWFVARALFETEVRFSDVPLFRGYGEQLADGSMPYRDFELEYPPGALPLFLLPALASADLEGFRLGFEALLLASGAVALGSMGAILVRLGASPSRQWGALLFAALSPLFLGRALAERYDLWPAALAVLALALALAGRPRSAGAALAVGTAAKFFPIALLPLLATWIWRRHGREEGMRFLAVFALVGLACVLPFVAASLGGVTSVVERQLDRPLQLESLGAAALIAAHHATGLSLGIESSYGSINLGGTKAAAVETVQSLVLVLVLIFVWGRFARTRASAATLVAASATAVTALVVLGKVLSPQFLVWAIPFVPLVAGRSGLLASALLGAACVLTQLYFPTRYLELIRLDEAPSAILIARDLLLAAVLVLLVRSFVVTSRADEGLVSSRAGPPAPRAI